MSTTNQKTPVRIVCPHCRRAYVIKVDLRRIYNAKPRAVCSRCGGRFDVVQRMYELETDRSTDVVDEGAVAGRRGDGRARRKRPRTGSPRPKESRQAAVGAAEPAVPSVRSRAVAPTPPPEPEIEPEPSTGPGGGERPRPEASPRRRPPEPDTLQDKGPSPRGRAQPDHAHPVGGAAAGRRESSEVRGAGVPQRQSSSQEAGPGAHEPSTEGVFSGSHPSIEPSTFDRPTAPAPAPALPSLSMMRPTVPAAADGSAAAGEAQDRPDRDSRPESEPLTAGLPDVPAELGAEALLSSLSPDLDAPLPWLGQPSINLGSVSFELPESAAALEWLLTERPGRPPGASPPPIPFEAYETVSESDLVEESVIESDPPRSADSSPQSGGAAAAVASHDRPEPGRGSSKEGGASPAADQVGGGDGSDERAREQDRSVGSAEDERESAADRQTEASAAPQDRRSTPRVRPSAVPTPPADSGLGSTLDELLGEDEGGGELGDILDGDVEELLGRGSPSPKPPEDDGSPTNKS